MAKKNPLRNIEIKEGVYGTVYRIRIAVKGKRYTASRDTLPEAIQWRDESITTLRSGGTLEGDIPAGDMLLGDALSKFIHSSRKDKARNTIHQYLSAETQLIKYFGEKRLLSSIRPPHILEYIDKRQITDSVSGSKICQELSLIRLVYEYAQAYEVNLPSPELSIKRPKKRTDSREDRLDKVITINELQALLKESQKNSHSLYLFLLFLLYTGMRPSEAASLRKRRLSMKDEKDAKKEKRHIGYFDKVRGGFSRVGTKTETRFVPGHPIAIAIVNYLIQQNSGSQFLFLPNNHGQKDRPYLYFRWKFRNSRKNAKIDNMISLREDINFYYFRHTARSKMASCGIQDSAAETIIGHADHSMKAVYTHYNDIELIEQIQKLQYPWTIDMSIEQDTSK